MTTFVVSVPDPTWDKFYDLCRKRLPAYIVLDGKRKKTTMVIAIRLLVEKAVKEYEDTLAETDSDLITAK